MPTSTNDDEKRLRRYFLKLATDDELDRIEEVYLATSNYAGLIDDVENRLVSDYVQGRLTGEEKQAFEAHYLLTEERRAEVAIANALESATAQESVRRHARERQWVFLRFFGWLGSPGPVLGLAAAATIVVLITTNVVLFVRWREQTHRIEVAGEQIRTLRASQEKVATPSPKTARVLVIPSLRIEGTDLAQGEERKLVFRLPAEPPDTIEIPLEIQQSPGSAPTDAVLAVSGKTLWVDRAVRMRVAGGVQYTDLQIPFASLKPYLDRPLKLEITERDHATLATFQLTFDMQKGEK